MNAQAGSARSPRWVPKRRRALTEQDGSIIIVVMMFTLVFLILGVSLYWLVSSQTDSTELERSDLKSFNVAESGVDAGMLALVEGWPRNSSEAIDVAALSAGLKTALQAENATLWDPSHSDISEFVQVTLFDNSASGVTVSVPPAEADRVAYDANLDGMMFVEATANVDDDRHRILIMAERQTWGLDFDTYAMYATSLTSNTIFDVGVDYDEDLGEWLSADDMYCGAADITNRDIEYNDGVEPTPGTAEFDNIISDAKINALLGLAKSQGTYFDDDDPDARPVSEADDFLTSDSDQENGAVVYIKSDSAVSIAGNNQVGSESDPVVVIIDTPDGTENGWDMTGTADFWGILIVLGDSTLKGTCSIHGSLYCEGSLVNKGNGHDYEVYYNERVRTNVNFGHTLSVNIVPNSWEEYTVAD